MKVLLSERVETDIANQLEYGVHSFGQSAAERTFARVDRFLFKFLPQHPDAGRHHAAHGMFEAAIPRTPFVVFYRVDEIAREIIVLALFHHAQDRSTFEPE